MQIHPKRLGWLVGLIVTTAASDAAWAFNSSAWTRPQNEAWSLVSFGYVAGGTQFLPDGTETDFVQGINGRNTYEDASFYAQLQYGLIDGLTLSTTLPYKRIFIEQEAFLTETQALGDLYLGLRAGVFELFDVRSPIAWSVEAGVSLPTGYTRNLAPSVGAGNLDIEIKTSLGYGLKLASWLPAYAQVGVGLRIRTGVFAFSGATDCNLTSDQDCVVDSKPDYSEELLYLGELGVTPLAGGVLLFGKVFGAHSIPEPEVGFTAANPIPERQRYLKAGVGGAVYPFRLFGATFLTPLGLTFQHYWTVVGQNTPVTNDLFVGLEMTYRF